MQADNLGQLRFRIKNTNNKVCPSKEEKEAKKSDTLYSEGTTCKPRCVEINFNNSVSSNLQGIGGHKYMIQYELAITEAVLGYLDL